MGIIDNEIPAEKFKKRDFRQDLTNRIVEMLESGVKPWTKPWDVGMVESGLPHNPISGTRYRGANRLQLMIAAATLGYADPRWLTIKQANSKGWKVRSGEKSTMVEYWKWYDEVERENEDTGEPERVRVKLESPRVFFAYVFNAAQIDGIPELAVDNSVHWSPVEAAEDILRNSRAEIFHLPKDRAAYNYGSDIIMLPQKTSFKSAENYYATALHELCHWTGHPSRLNRTFGEKFGDENYAREELRAEIASAFLMAEIGLNGTLENHASYIHSWVDRLKEDKHEIFKAAADAEKAADFVLRFQHGLTDKDGVVEVDENEEFEAILPPTPAFSAPRPSV